MRLTSSSNGPASVATGIIRETAMNTTTLTRVACIALLASTNFSFGQGLNERIERLRLNQPRAEEKLSKPHFLNSLMNTRVSVQFQETPAPLALTHLASVVDITIVARYVDQRHYSGIDPNTLITLEAQDQTALHVLEQVLEQCSLAEPCTWQLRHGFVEVGSTERLSVPAARETRTYAIGDLLQGLPNFDNAPGIDLDAALNQGAGSAGGSGGGGFGGGGGSGGGGGVSGGGSIFRDLDLQLERTPSERLAQNIVDLITTTIEPEAWVDKWATIHLHHGVLVIRAPDYIHRQIGGYSFAPKKEVD